jgi:hypothetical protein
LQVYKNPLSTLLAFKLIATPSLIALVTLAGRRWGSGISGWLVGLPLTSGPISIFLALQYGQTFAARAAIGTLGGIASVGAFSLAYCLAAKKANWFVSASAAIMTFFLATYLWNRFSLPLLPTFLIVIVILTLVLYLIPPAPDLDKNPLSITTSRWDIPTRMFLATAFVILITAFATNLGPQLSGLLTPFPVFSTILVAFAHKQQGPEAGIRFIRGLVTGSFAFATFFLATGGFLMSLGMVVTYSISTLAALLINVVSLRTIK